MYMKVINFIFIIAFLSAIFTVLIFNTLPALLLFLGSFGALISAIWLPRARKMA